VNWFQANAGFLLLALFAVVLILLAWLAVIQMQLIRASRQYEALVGGTSGGNLEQVLNDHIAEMRAIAGRVRELDNLYRQIEAASSRSLQWTGVVRYNPFPDTGGDQSFAIALMDGEGNGVVISSLHARDQTRIYAKPLRNWQSTYQLSEEEKGAIARAHRQQGETPS
jgi:hypothetical protein